MVSFDPGETLLEAVEKAEVAQETAVPFVRCESMGFGLRKTPKCMGCLFLGGYPLKGLIRWGVLGV